MGTIIVIIIIAIIGPLAGSLIGVIKKPSDNVMYNMLAFAAGVMLSVSFLELAPESIKFSSEWICTAGIFTGALLMYLVDRMLPHIHPGLCAQEQGCELKKTATFLVIGLFLHNFPEGMAMAIGSISDMRISLAIALAIAIHDIPEAICTAAPYYYCTGNRLKSFLVSSVTALPTVVGFVLAYFLYKVIPLQVVGFIIAATAGLMIYICADELIPTSAGKAENHGTIFSLVAGVLFVILLGNI